MQGPLQELDRVPGCGGLLLWQAGNIWKRISIAYQSNIERWQNSNWGWIEYLWPTTLVAAQSSLPTVSIWLAGRRKPLLPVQRNWSVLLHTYYDIKVGVAPALLHSISLTRVWQFHCEAVRYMGSGLGRGKWLNGHRFKSFLIIICPHV